MTMDIVTKSRFCFIGGETGQQNGGNKALETIKLKLNKTDQYD